MMISFLNKFKSKRNLGTGILRKNDISILIFDERWNNLFSSNDKTPELVKHEEVLKETLKEQARLITEAKSIAATKKKCLETIIRLTDQVYEKQDDSAKKEMLICEKTIKEINNRSLEIEEELDAIPDKIKDANIKLLECAINLIYFKIRGQQKRVEELDCLIEETRSKLKSYIDEKESLSQDNSDVYSYFHDLLGAEELEKLDKEHFGS